MIVKDESEQLSECLTSIQDLSEQVCIVDTGSSDDTVEIARRHGAEVTFFIWCDDFSAARNESLRCCKGDWIFILDADERIDSGDHAKIRALTDGSSIFCYRFTTRNYTNTTSVGDFHPCEPGDPNARGFAGWYPSVKVRLFPNHVGGRFEGRIHELVNASLEARGIRPVECEVPIHHYPYLKKPERILRKQEMYLELGRLKAEANPSDPKAFVELGNQYAEVGDYASAASAYREALRLNSTDALVLKDLGGVLHLLKRNEEAKRALRLALKFDPCLMDAWRNLGVIHADEKDWETSVECFEHCIELEPGWADGQRYLSVALQGAGRLAEAVEAARKSLDENPHSKGAMDLYIHQMLRLERRAEARENLERLVENGVSHPEMRNAIGELFYYDNLLDEAKEHFLAAGRGGITSAYNNLGVVYYRQRLYHEAKKAFENCLASDPGHRGARTNLDKTLSHLNQS
jgi:tetratricopeptide (TPR) repeat protein